MRCQYTVHSVVNAVRQSCQNLISMMTMSDWRYEGSIFELPEDFSSDDFYGFVYNISNNITNKKYIGKKFFWSKKVLPITKKRKRRKHTLVESDWRDYWGSNKWLVKDVEEHGEENFTREILHLCKSKGECAYTEAKVQFELDVLLREDYYNGIISLRCNASAIKGLHHDKI